MTSEQIRQSFLDFFKSKGHTIVPSASLMPDSPGLLFTNAGMNQFVPIFLNERAADVDKWPGAIPGKATRAADTQKCIRAGGKHNDLEDVGLDTSHHTFFEMLGNWSFGDYFKKEAIEWAWELIVEKWKFPVKRIYATVYSPDKSKGDPSDFDEEAYDYWAAKFTAAGLDPKVHIVHGNKKDNFWMMGETGPCGPCSEVHIDLTPEGNTEGSLVNKGDPRCMEIWNLVFIQFNANPDGTFVPLPAKHVDTGMGFERAASIIQGTKNFSDFANAKISNYETDIFRPIFDKLEQLSGKKYASTLPNSPVEDRNPGSAVVPTAPVGVPPTERPAPGATYYKRRLPHFERPWAKYMISFSTHERRSLSTSARDVVLKSLLFGDQQRRYQLFAACVMPDHVHLLIEPQIKEQDKEGHPVFWPLGELLHSIKSFTAHEINSLEKTTGSVWENESFDRMIRGDADLEEKFHYICRNPWDSGIAPPTENYPWLWTPDVPGSATVPVALARVSRDSSASIGESGQRDADRGDRDGRAPHTKEQIQIDIAFRVIADHIRTLSFSIADGILPGNTDRNYVLRRILRRAVRYGRTLGFHEPFFYKLVEVLTEKMGDVFPELRKKQSHVQEVIKAEEEAFNKTLDKGISIFEQRIKIQSDIDEVIKELHESSFVAKTKEDMRAMPDAYEAALPFVKRIRDRAHKAMFGSKHSYGDEGAAFKIISMAGESLTPREDVAVFHGVSKLYNRTKEIMEAPDDLAPKLFHDFINTGPDVLLLVEKSFAEARLNIKPGVISGAFAFQLYDTYGFPLDLTELMARERGLAVDKEGFEKLMEEQRTRARAAQKKEIIAASNIDTSRPTKFVGFDSLSTPTTALSIVKVKDKIAVTVDASPLYAEMGGQVGDTGEIQASGKIWQIVNTQKTGNTFLHFLADKDAPEAGAAVELRVNAPRRAAIQRHHTVTHLLHWALHEVVSPDATQKGSYVGPDKLTFDFSSVALTPAQIADVEKLVNERIVENAGVIWTEVPYAEIKGRKEVMQFFGEKYGDVVRVVQIGGRSGGLDGYSMELCGGTHVRATGEIGLFRILGESAVAAGIRRIEAVAGLRAYEKSHGDAALISTLAAKVNAPVLELEKKIESLLAQQKELEKQLKAAQQKQAAETARALVKNAQTFAGTSVIIENLGAADGDFLQAVADALKGQFKGVVVLGGCANEAVALVASVSTEFTAKFQAGKIIQAIAPLVGGKGGGKPDNARGGGKDVTKLPAALDKARELIAATQG